jgi:hypothetical protein
MKQICKLNKQNKSKISGLPIMALFCMVLFIGKPIEAKPRTLEIVSKNTNGEIGNRNSGNYDGSIAISRDGNIVAFLSSATNLDSPVDTQTNIDVYVRDRRTGETKCISKLDNDRHRNVHTIDISEDGRYIVYVRDSYVDQWFWRCNEVYVYDRYTEQTYWITENFPYEWDYDCYTYSFYYPSISDGQYVAFTVNNIELEDYIPGYQAENDYMQVIVRNVETWELQLVSANINGDAGYGNSGYDGNHRNIDISYDGRFITFASTSNDLVENDNNGDWIEDIFVRDRDPDENGIFDQDNAVTEPICINIDGGIGGNYTSCVPSISDDGRYVAFHSAAGNLIPNDWGGSGDCDIFLRDRLLQKTTLVSFSLLGNEPNDGSGTESVAISGNGRVVSFGSSKKLIQEDNNGYCDVYIMYSPLQVIPAYHCCGYDNGSASGIINIYPNPSQGMMNISYQLVYHDLVKVSVYDINGRLIKVLENDVKEHGSYTLQWDGCDDFGRTIASGTYIIHLETSDYQYIKKAVVLQ